LTQGETRGAFVRSRLGSLLAVVPLGLWTCVHLWNNLAAFDGAEAWQKSVTTYPHPVAQFVTMAIVLGPLVLHTVWGIGRIAKGRPNNVRYGYYANLKYVLQRLSAVGLVLFLGAHLWLALLKPRMTEGHAETFADISHEMHFHGPTLAVYVLGVLGVAYHLANGLHGFCMGWGVVSSRKSLKQLEGAVLAFFLLLLGLGWAAVYALWRAGAHT
jgi:succinate dehydrogenase / fumarate reductase cytochrome b subunit